jgi:hypothetical protein
MREYVDGGKRRLWYDDDEIERLMESELAKARMLPTAASPAVDLERFIAGHLRVRMDQYATELDDSVLGLTKFLADGSCKILIQRRLSKEVDQEEDCPPGIRGRWRATMAHEAAHVLLHRRLFPITSGQRSLFGDGPSGADQEKAMLRCLARDVGVGARGGPPEEVQANKGMAALLMPRSVFRPVATEMLRGLGVAEDTIREGDAREARVVLTMATRFEVSKQAAAIRLRTLSIVLPVQKQGLF